MSSEDEMNNWEKPPAATKHRAQPRKPSSKRAQLDPDNIDDGADQTRGKESAPTTNQWKWTERKAQVNTAATSSEVKSRKELDRWKQKAKEPNDTDCSSRLNETRLSKQLEDLFQIRKTEPEQALEQLQVQYDERAKTQDALVKELTSQLVALHFLTREAADEEKRAVEQDISRLQEVIKAKDSVIDEKTNRIAELEQSVQDAIRERDAEIERSKELLARAAPKGTPISRPHSKRPFGMDDPKMTETCLNLLVAGVKFEHAPDSEEPDVIFHCVYTYYEMTRRADDIEGERIGINFTMRIFNGFGGPNGEPASEEGLYTSPGQIRTLNLTGNRMPLSRA
ncbi:hypothetical protein EV363DRAFT_1294090 [Boletus edulis]|nr:hypothetical protein EV363DRAFT_1294090 [Boletus edulis]